MYSPSQSMAIKVRHSQARERGKADASALLWEFDGRHWNRYQIMELLVARVAEGESLVDICKDTAFPTLREVRGWYRNHPAFLEEMLEAEACRGAILGELALTTVEGEYDKDDVPRRKLQHDAYAKHAARLNTEYQDKQVIKQEGELDRLSQDQLQARLASLLEANPALKELFEMPRVIQDAEILDASGGLPVLENKGDA